MDRGKLVRQKAKTAGTDETVWTVKQAQDDWKMRGNVSFTIGSSPDITISAGDMRMEKFVCENYPFIKGSHAEKVERQPQTRRNGLSSNSNNIELICACRVILGAIGYIG